MKQSGSRNATPAVAAATDVGATDSEAGATEGHSRAALGAVQKSLAGAGVANRGDATLGWSS
jgi:hypothetical protein